jgi:hypothetical protein
MHSWRRAHAKPREFAFNLLGVALVLGQFPSSASDYSKVAGRAFRPEDIVILSFDSVSYREAADVMSAFMPSHGRKIIYSDATTPYPTTSVAWRSILSGTYPPPMAVLPNLRWGQSTGSWLPADLRKLGYSPIIVQDMSWANWFSDEEGVSAIGPQGWKASVHELLWRIGLPVSMVGAKWWVKLVKGPWNSATRYAYRGDDFLDDALVEVATSGRKGHIFAAVHTCLVHGPLQLSLGEARRIPGWWKMSGAVLAGQEYAGPKQREVRMATLRHVLQWTLEGLDRRGVLGRATVFVMSDHGPREATFSPRTTSSVMLALFDPTGRGEAVVGSPVSLVDIAPTIRQILGMQQPAADGLPLPDGSRQADANRAVVSRPLQHLDGIFDTVGTSRRLSLSDLRQVARLRPDGTFDYTAAFLQQVDKEIRACCSARQ